MWKRLSQYLFKSPDEIGLDNYLVLVFCLLTVILGILGTFINIGLHLSVFTIICTTGVTVIFSLVYLYSWKKGEYIFSKYIIIILGIILLNVQWFINYGSTGPILYLFVVVESFIIVFFNKKEKFIFTVIVFANVTVLFYIEYLYPATIGKYSSESARLIDLYTGLLIYLFLSILLLSVAIGFYIRQQEKAQLSDKLKSAFLANMSHEIRTPMNGILGFAELLKEPNLTGDEQQEYISIIEKSGERMLNIIIDIIDISKIESGLMKVEDDNASLMLISREVKKYCRELLTVKTGKAAVETCRNNPEIDLILMDIKMPGMDGYEATREIRKFNQNVFIIAQTAFALSGDRDKSFEAGCDEYISKPINNVVLKSLIEEHFLNRDHSGI